MKRLFYCVSVVTITLAAVFFLIILYWIINPYNTMKILNGNAVPVDKTTYKPGDRITYTLKYCKKGNTPGTVSRSLVNSIKINFTDYTGNIQEGCGTLTKNDLVIPDFVDEGIYHIETTAQFRVNPLKTYDDSWRSVDFRIEK